MPVEFSNLNPERIFTYARLENPLNCTNGCCLQFGTKADDGEGFQWDWRATARLALAQAAGVRAGTSEVFALGSRSKTSWRYSAGLMP